MHVSILLAVLMALAAVFFALQNTDIVTIRFFSWMLDGSLALILLVTFAIGFLSSLILSIPSLLKYRIQLASERHKTKAYEAGKKPPKPPQNRFL